MARSVPAPRPARPAREHGPLARSLLPSVVGWPCSGRCGRTATPRPRSPAVRRRCPSAPWTRRGSTSGSRRGTAIAPRVALAGYARPAGPRSSAAAPGRAPRGLRGGPREGLHTPDRGGRRLGRPVGRRRHQVTAGARKIRALRAGARRSGPSGGRLSPASAASACCSSRKISFRPASRRSSHAQPGADRPTGHLAQAPSGGVSPRICAGGKGFRHPQVQSLDVSAPPPSRHRRASHHSGPGPARCSRTGTMAGAPSCCPYG
jgi:hypothetical protein